MIVQSVPSVSFSTREQRESAGVIEDQGNSRALTEFLYLHELKRAGQSLIKDHHIDIGLLGQVTDAIGKGYEGCRLTVELHHLYAVASQHTRRGNRSLRMHRNGAVRL